MTWLDGEALRRALLGVFGAGSLLGAFSTVSCGEDRSGDGPPGGSGARRWVEPSANDEIGPQEGSGGGCRFAVGSATSAWWLLPGFVAWATRRSRRASRA